MGQVQRGGILNFWAGGGAPPTCWACIFLEASSLFKTTLNKKIGACRTLVLQSCLVGPPPARTSWAAGEHAPRQPRTAAVVISVGTRGGRRGSALEPLSEGSAVSACPIQLELAQQDLSIDTVGRFTFFCFKQVEHRRARKTVRRPMQGGRRGT